MLTDVAATPRFVEALPITSAPDTISRMATTGWLAAALSGRVERSLSDLDRERASADAAGDVARVEAIDAELDQRVADWRSRVSDEQRTEAQKTRELFSSGVRRPVAPRLSPSQRMNQAILRATGRSR